MHDVSPRHKKLIEDASLDLTEQQTLDLVDLEFRIIYGETTPQSYLPPVEPRLNTRVFISKSVLDSLGLTPYYYTSLPLRYWRQYIADERQALYPLLVGGEKLTQRMTPYMPPTFLKDGVIEVSLIETEDREPISTTTLPDQQERNGIERRLGAWLTSICRNREVSQEHRKFLMSLVGLIMWSALYKEREDVYSQLRVDLTCAYEHCHLGDELSDEEQALVIGSSDYRLKSLVSSMAYNYPIIPLVESLCRALVSIK